MAIVRNQLALKMRGRVGAFSYYTESGRQIVRQAQNTTNYGETARRTETQQMRRAKWGNLVNFYKISKDWMHKAYETKKSNQSDYNKFMSLNTNIVTCYLQKGQIAVGGCVVEPYIVSEGSLRTIDVRKQGNVWRTDIAIGSLIIQAGTTIAQFTEAVLAANPHVREGYQLSFISYQQDEVTNQLPQIICTAYEVTLNREDNGLLRDYLPEFCTQSLDGFVATDNNISVGCFAYIWSTSVGGKTLVSTQTLINNNQVLINKFTTFQAYNASIQSYGVDVDKFLMTGSRKIKAASQPQYIESISCNGKTRTAGEYVGKLSAFFTMGEMEVKFANDDFGQVSAVLIGLDTYRDGHVFNEGLTVSGKNVYIDYATVASVLSAEMDSTLVSIVVRTTDGDFEILFPDQADPIE